MQISEFNQWDKYDKIRMDHQNKTIIELQNEIKE
jgi:hypothetical protein